MGCMIFIDRNLVGWWCRKQRTVALSSMEAEYIANCSASRNGLYVLQVLGELTDQKLTPVPIYMDNQAAQTFSSRNTTNEKTKHIDIAHHFVRELIARGIFTSEHVDTQYNFADLFTKALTGERNQWLGKAILGMSNELMDLFRPPKFRAK